MIGKANTTVRVANDSVYLVRRHDRNQSMFVDQTGTYRRDRERGEPSVSHTYRKPRFGVAKFVVAPSLSLPANASGNAVRVTTITSEDRRLYRIHLTEPGSIVSSDDVLVENYTATLYVRPSGLVETTRISYDSHSGSTHTSYEARITFRNVGTTAVETPEWVTAYRGGGTRGENATEPVTTTANATG